MLLFDDWRSLLQIVDGEGDARLFQVSVTGKAGQRPIGHILGEPSGLCHPGLDGHQIDLARLLLRGSRGILLRQAFGDRHFVLSAVEPLNQGRIPHRVQVQLAVVGETDLDLIAPLILVVGSMEGLSGVRRS